MNRPSSLTIGVLLIMLLNALPTLAGDAAQAVMAETGVLGATIGDDVLDVSRGGHVEINNTNNVDATLYDNQAIGNITGQNQITTGAFAGSNGMNTVIQNSGNNVIIQSATILNLQMQ